MKQLYKLYMDAGLLKESDASGSFPQVTREDSEPGIKTKYWFWASDIYEALAKKKKEADEKANTLEVKPQESAKKPKRKNNKVKESGFHDGFINCRFLESEASIETAGNRFKVALIQEGLGNLRDAFYYTRACLESAVSAFEGKKCYADHPSRTDEMDRPERSVRDIVGHFENVHVEENADGSAMLCADLVMLPDEPFEWARSLVRHAVEYSKTHQDKEFIGLSINASGDAKEIPAEKFLQAERIPDSCKPKLMSAIEQGLTVIRVVNAITDAVSTDLVTEPGAKGKVIEMLENEKEQKMEDVKTPLFKEAEKKEEAKKEADQEQKPGADADHADAEQDKKLILDMIKKHMGGDNATDMEDEAMEAAHQAYEAYKEMGYEEKDAAKHAAASMKLAKHMSQKQCAKPAESALPKEAEEVKKEAEQPKEADKKEEECHESHKEAMAKLVAENIALKKKIQESEFASILDSKLKESKLPRAQTDAIRKLEPKNEKELEKYITIFAEAGKPQEGERSESVAAPKNIFVTSVEKQTMTETKGKFSFGDCKK